MNTNVNIDDTSIGDNNAIGNIYNLISQFNSRGLNLLTADYFNNYESKDENYENWKKGFDFELEDIKSDKDFKRTDLIIDLLDRLESQGAVLITGIQGIGKTTILMDIICELFEKGKTILYNMDNSDLPTISELSGFFEELLESNNDLYVVIDNVHSINMSVMFYLWDRLSSHQRAKNIKYLFSARQPEYDRLVWNQLNLVNLEKHRESIRKFNLKTERIFEIPEFSEDEIKGFMLKYPDDVEVHFTLRESEVPTLNGDPNDPNQLFSFLKQVTGGLPGNLKYFAFNQHETIMQDIQRTCERHLGKKENLQAYVMGVMLEWSEIKITEDLLSMLSIDKEFYELLDIIVRKKSDGTFKTMSSMWNSSFFINFNQSNESYTRVEIFRNIFEKIKESRDENLAFKIIQSVYLNYREFHLTTDILEKSVILPEFLKSESLCSLFGSFMTSPYYENRSFQKVVDLCDRALKIDNSFIPALINKSAAHIHLKEYSKAFLTSLQILSLDISNVSGWINKGLALSGLNESIQALCCLEKALQIDSLNPETWYNKGNIYVQMKLDSYAINSYNKCLDLNPDHSHSLVNKGLAYYRLKEYTLAEGCFKNALDLDPNNLNAKNGKALCYHEQGRNNEAIEILDDIINSEPLYLEAWHNKILCLNKTDPKRIPQVIEDAKKYRIKINLLNKC